MAGLVYPASLPGPISAPFQSAERRLLSSIPGPRQSRPMQRDRKASQQLDFIFTHAECAIFKAWLDADLVRAGAWFAASWPQPQGGVGVRRFVGEPSFPIYYPNVGWHVSANVEVRGRGMAPAGPPGGFVDSGGGWGDGGTEGSVPTETETTTIRVGDIIDVFVMHEADVTLAGFANSGAHADSSGSYDCTWFLRVADGTADDGNRNFVFSGATKYAYAEVIVRGVVSTMNTAVEPVAGQWRSTDYNPPAVTFGAGATTFNIEVGICFAVDNGFRLATPSAGYTLAVSAVNSYLYTNPITHGTVQDFIQLFVAYSTSTAATENPSIIDNGSGQLSGGTGSVTVRHTYI